MRVLNKMHPVSGDWFKARAHTHQEINKNKQTELPFHESIMVINSPMHGKQAVVMTTASDESEDETWSEQLLMQHPQKPYVYLLVPRSFVACCFSFFAVSPLKIKEGFLFGLSLEYDLQLTVFSCFASINFTF